MPRFEACPLTSDRWSDFEELFGARGACGGCWCQWWRKCRADYERDKGEPNRSDMRALVAAGTVPGVVGYLDGVPAGWCSAGPRSDFVRLGNSRVLRPIDSEPVWSIVCLFVQRRFRRQGLAVRLVHATCEIVRSQGAATVEAYPIVPRGKEVPDMTAWTGFPRIFEEAGFTNVAQPSAARAIYRRKLTLQSR